MVGRKVQDMLMAWVAQQCPALPTSTQVLGHKRHLAPLGHHSADVETPGGVEVLDPPVVTCHLGSLLDDMRQMSGKIAPGTGLPQMPYDLTRGYHKRGISTRVP
jgi:hypothetical protein